MEYRKQQFETYEAFTQQFSCDYSQPLARGGHGEIYRGVDLETNEEVAIKRRLYSPDSDLITLEKEFTHTQALPLNRFVVRYVYYGRYATPFGTFEFLVMKFYRDGNLTHDALPWKQLTEAQRRRFTEEFLKGLAHLHRHQVIHRDIKPENILLVKYIDADGAAYRPVIADFGISKLLSENPEAHNLMQNSMRVGTVTYMAPEQLRAQNLSYNADLWAFGIILYEIITGKYMIARRSFPDLQREEAYTFWRNADEQRYPPDMDLIPEPYQQIIRRCLLADPTERAQSTDELLALLSVQPQLAEVEQLIKTGDVAGAIDLLETIESRASLPSVSQKLNELRLQDSLDKPIEPDVPQADRPVEWADDDLPEETPVAEEEPLLPSMPFFPVRSGDDEDDGQRTQQFTEQLDPAWLEPLNKPTVSPLAEFRLPDSIKGPIPRPIAEPVKTNGKTTGKQKAPQLAAEPVMAGQPTPDEPFTDPDVPVVDGAADVVSDDVAAEPEMDLNAVQEEVQSSVTQPVTDTAETQQPDAAADSQTEAFTDADERQADAVATLRSAFDEPQALPTTDRPVGIVQESVLATPPSVLPTETPGADGPALPPKPPRPTLPTMPVREWIDDLRDGSRELYDKLKTRKNARIVGFAGVGLILLSVLIYSPDSQPAATQVQTAPVVSEDYRKALKLFKEYQVRYEKTGELNPYLWAFEHCNPDYVDSLEVRSAIVRAQSMVDYTQLIFPESEANMTGFKRQEMKHILQSKGRWERLPHDLNCAPGQLLEDEQATR